MVIELSEPGGKVQRQVANPIRFSRSAHQYKFTGVELGAHTEQVLGQLGFDRNAIDALRKKAWLAKPGGAPNETQSIRPSSLDFFKA